MYLVQVRDFNEASSIMQKLVDNGEYRECSPKVDSLCGIRKETWDKCTNQIFEIKNYYPDTFNVIQCDVEGPIKLAFPGACLKVLCEENEECIKK